jgi:SAM-dependent methyltransferase
MSTANLALVPCPLCGAHEGFLRLNITRTDLHIHKYGALYEGKPLSEWKACGRCGFVHQNPRPTLEALQDFYSTGQYHPPTLPGDTGQYLEFARWYFTEKIDYAVAHAGPSPGRVLEIGCGLGGALSVFQELGWATLGIEPDSAQARFATHTLGLAGVRQGLVDASLSLDPKVDLVFSNHAFEHFADLDSVIQGVSRVLKPGGHIFTAVPTYFSNRSRDSKAWMNSAHYSLFTHQSLNQLLARHGFEEIRHTYRGWRKEIDDLWHVARYSGVPLKAEVYFEVPRAVQRYVNLINPVRSLLYAPLYAGYSHRVAFQTRVARMWTLLRRSPVDFFRKVAKRCLRAVHSISR